MINKVIFISLLVLNISFSAFGFDYAKADSAYYNKNYEEAALLYSQAMEQEGISAGLLYNLGNTYYKLNREGEAMLCYERAKKLDPGNEMINRNMEFLSSKITDANKGSLQGKAGNVEPEPDSFIYGIYRLIAIDRTSNGWAVFAVMAFILFLGGLALYIFTPNVLARKTGFFSGLTFLGFTVVFLIFAFLSAHQYEKKDQAIIMDFTAELLEKPEENAKPSSTPLHKGTKLKILETKKGADGTEWLKVRLNSDNTGWLKKDEIEII